jgi:hypothetical protein
LTPLISACKPLTRGAFAAHIALSTIWVGAPLKIPYNWLRRRFMPISRRVFLALGPVGAALLPDASAARTAAAAVAPAENFPAHDPAIVREMVGASHGNVARVRELLSSRPAMANATWDWGYGDWETSLGAASHVGNREIAALLLAAGARPTMFSAAMLGQLDVVKAFITAAPGVERTRGPHGITLAAHAKAGGAAEVVRYLDTLSGANVPYVDQPLDGAERTALLGTYAFGSGPAQQLIVAVSERGTLGIQRDGAAARPLFHLGSRVFHPSGAGAVRIRFAPGAPAGSLMVEDGPVVVTATRVG